MNIKKKRTENKITVPIMIGTGRIMIMFKLTHGTNSSHLCLPEGNIIDNAWFTSHF